MQYIDYWLGRIEPDRQGILRQHFGAHPQIQELARGVEQGTVDAEKREHAVEWKSR
jgi:hypothetical protein